MFIVSMMNVVNGRGFDESDIADFDVWRTTTAHDVSFRNSRANYLNSIIKANAKYSIVNKKLKGKISIFDYLVEDKLIGNSEFYLKDTLFDCDSEILVTNKKTKQFLDKFQVTGECISANANIVGINLNKISEKVDNIETFQDFFNLFNKNEMKGNTPLDSINFTFKLKESILFLNQLEAFVVSKSFLG